MSDIESRLFLRNGAGYEVVNTQDEAQFRSVRRRFRGKPDELLAALVRVDFPDLENARWSEPVDGDRRYKHGSPD